MQRLKLFFGLHLVTLVFVGWTSVQAVGQQQPQREYGAQVGIDLQTHVEQSRVAILPLGSIEYHGPSGPPLTDSMIAEGLARRIAPDLRASVFPVLSYTHAPAHSAAYRGTVSVRGATVTVLLEDVLTSLVDNGFDRILVLNGHDGNIGPARAAISRVTHNREGTQMVLVSWWETLPTPDVESLNLFTSGNGGHGHGGPLELSVAAVFAPDSVRPAQGPDLPALTGHVDFPYYLEKGDVTGWPGYSGKLSEISAASGEKLVQLSARRLVKLVATWLRYPNRPGSW